MLMPGEAPTPERIFSPSLVKCFPPNPLLNSSSRAQSTWSACSPQAWAVRRLPWGASRVRMDRILAPVGFHAVLDQHHLAVVALHGFGDARRHPGVQAQLITHVEALDQPVGFFAAPGLFFPLAHDRIQDCSFLSSSRRR